MLRCKHNPKPSHPPTCQQWGAKIPCQASGSPLSSPATCPDYRGQIAAENLSSHPPDRPTLSTPEKDGLTPGPEHHALISSVLRDGWMPGDPRTFDYITRDAKGFRGWTTHKNRCLDPDSAASLVLRKDIILGLPHRYKTRILAYDFDNHSSLEWTRDDPRIHSLIRTAEAGGCGAELVPTPRGFHLWVLTPEPVPIIRAHWLAQTLLRRAGLEGLQRLEIFPSLAREDPEDDPKERTISHGVRLPGQAGTVIAGDPFSDPVLIWAALRGHLDRLKPSPAFDRLLRHARALEKRQRKRNINRARFLRLPPSHAAAARIAKEITWTGPGQSNDNLGRLANAGHIAGHRTLETLALFIEEKALLAPGFHQHASADTVRRLTPWSQSWAASCLKSPPRSTGTHRPRSADPGRNARLHRETVCSFLDGVQRAARTFGTEALGWSERKIAEFCGISRSTLRRIEFHWRLRVLFSLNRPQSEHPAAGGSDPSHQGGGVAVFQEKSISLPASPHREPCQLHGKHPPPPSATDQNLLPTAPKKVALSPSSWLAQKCTRERDELLRWIGLAPA